MDEIDLEKKKAKTYLYKRLSQKNYCSLEIKKKMRDQAFSIELVEELLLECERLGYINDKEWLASFIRGAKAKKQGPLLIIQKLLSKGFCKETIKEALALEDSEEERKTRIMTLLLTRYKNLDLNDFKERQKVIGSLIRKGFSFEEIIDTLNLENKNRNMLL